MATSRQINEVMDDIRILVRMWAEGATVPEIATALGWRQEEVRRAAKWEGLSFSPMANRSEVCVSCGRPCSDRDNTGFCRRCQLRLRIERLQAVYAEEERREVERQENELDAVKQAGHRMREEYDIAPRKGARVSQ